MADLQLDFEIEGDKALLRRFRGIDEKLKNWYPEFKKVGADLLKTFKYNFAVTGGELEKPWASLARSTVIQKRVAGVLAQGPLVWSGKMKRSFQSRPEKYQVTVWNPVEYFKYHQSKHQYRGGRLPRRVMMALTRKKKQWIGKEFQKSVETILKSRNLGLGY